MPRSPKSNAKRNQPRVPASERGIERYQALLHSLDQLLLIQNPEDIGLYQIADAAGIPPASVYHFFATKEAAFRGLALRYLDELDRLKIEPIDPYALRSWETLAEWDLERVVDYYNERPNAMKLFLGGFGGVETRQVDLEHDVRAAQALYERYARLFRLPYIANPAGIFHIYIKIIDSVLSTSYLASGGISPYFALQAREAAAAYLGLYVPKHLELYPDVASKLARGVPVASFGVDDPASENPEGESSDTRVNAVRPIRETSVAS